MEISLLDKIAPIEGMDKSPIVSVFLDISIGVGYT
jgi:hypothetical protein